MNGRASPPWPASVDSSEKERTLILIWPLCLQQNFSFRRRRPRWRWFTRTLPWMQEQIILNGSKTGNTAQMGDLQAVTCCCCCPGFYIYHSSVLNISRTFCWKQDGVTVKSLQLTQKKRLFRTRTWGDYRFSDSFSKEQIYGFWIEASLKRNQCNQLNTQRFVKNK